MALAPDSASQVAGRRLARPAQWSEVGWADPLLWGSCQGSGKTPYTVAVDVTTPTYRCSCPSRKFPCKHVLGLLFLWSEGGVDTGGVVSDFATKWAQRAQKSSGTSQTMASPHERTAEQIAAAAERAARRDQRVSDGMAELDRWLADQMRRGLAATKPDQARDMAARLVDAQAPAAATRLREIAAMPQGQSWLLNVLQGFALLHLLARAHQTSGSGPMRDTIRMRVGFTTSRDDVLATAPIRDRWLVTGMRDADEEQVSVRYVWLVGMDTGTPAQVLFFAPPGHSQPTSPLQPGQALDADLHFYPGQPQLRAALGDQHAASDLQGWEPESMTVDQVIAVWRHVLAADPWLNEWPVTLRGSVGTSPQGWALRDVTGRALRLHGDTVWPLISLTGGDPAIVFGEVGPDGLHATSVLQDGSVIPL